MSDTVPSEPVGDAGEQERPLPIDSDQIRVEEARRRAEQEVSAKVERVRSDALSGAVTDGGDEKTAPTPAETPPGEQAGTRYVGGRRLRTF